MRNKIAWIYLLIGKILLIQLALTHLFYDMPFIWAIFSGSESLPQVYGDGLDSSDANTALPGAWILMFTVVLLGLIRLLILLKQKRTDRFYFLLFVSTALLCYAIKWIHTGLHISIPFLIAPVFLMINGMIISAPGYRDYRHQLSSI